MARKWNAMARDWNAMGGFYKPMYRKGIYKMARMARYTLILLYVFVTYE